MKISKLIHQLHQMQVLHGDIEVGHEDGDRIIEYVEHLTPLYPFKKFGLAEDKTQPAWCIELS
ncbi:hypothetical protein UFOVP760_267 [uncultured Caudovirales phage]|uniref:Uncharacterized protein n=1 Tax=uncultured Caudovirales phage TaxID=2100421 RepID=A0A6J7X6H1_9CAUD|nr:hypothetical protein UFOVP760_267 [uncultured Caudovirales phage]